MQSSASAPFPCSHESTDLKVCGCRALLCCTQLMLAVTDCGLAYAGFMVEERDGIIRLSLGEKAGCVFKHIRWAELSAGLPLDAMPLAFWIALWMTALTESRSVPSLFVAFSTYTSSSFLRILVAILHRRDEANHSHDRCAPNRSRKRPCYPRSSNQSGICANASVASTCVTHPPNARPVTLWRRWYLHTCPRAIRSAPMYEALMHQRNVWDGAPAASHRRALADRRPTSRPFRHRSLLFSNPIPAVKRKRQPHTSVAGGRADEESASDLNALHYRS